MKHVLLTLTVLLLFAVSAMAQGTTRQASSAVSANTVNFNSPKPQFLSFNVGVPLGHDLKASEATAGYNFGIFFAIMEDFHVGYDFIRLENSSEENNLPAEESERTYNSFRLAYDFTPTIGGALSMGSLETLTETTTGVSLGVYSNVFQKRSTIGVAYGLRLRLDYLAPTKDFGDGVLMFTTGFNFGL